MLGVSLKSPKLVCGMQTMVFVLKLTFYCVIVGDINVSSKSYKKKQQQQQQQKVSKESES